MTRARTEHISLEETPYYHCMVRCVRRAYLCGEDRETGENYDHRKQWLVSRLRFLSYVYAIDICAYAVMSNHYHVVLHVDKGRALGWSDEEVVERWMQLYSGHTLVDRWLRNPADLSQAELDVVSELIETWRERLYDISWFMRGVNETIARMANKEDNCKGRFWEGRFKSQALLDETALLTCMAYVDLNPVRATITETLEDSDFTSIQQRLFDYAKDKPESKQSKPEQRVIQKANQQQEIKQELQLDELPEAPLMPLDGSSHTDIHTALPFTREDYFALVDATGRILREDKRGAIDPHRLPLIQQLNINPDEWLKHVRDFGRRYAHCAGNVASLKAYAEKHRQCWTKGIATARKVYWPVMGALDSRSSRE